MSCRHPAAKRPAARQHAHEASAVLAFNVAHLSRREALEEPPRRRPGRTSGRCDSMHRKNRSRLAIANRLALNIGWYGIGSPFSRIMPSTAARGREQDRRLERRHDERRPAVQRPAADVERVGDGRRPVLEAVARHGARQAAAEDDPGQLRVAAGRGPRAVPRWGSASRRPSCGSRPRAPCWPRGRGPSGSRTRPPVRRSSLHSTRSLIRQARDWPDP